MKGTRFPKVSCPMQNAGQIYLPYCDVLFIDVKKRVNFVED